LIGSKKNWDRSRASGILREDRGYFLNGLDPKIVLIDTSMGRYFAPRDTAFEGRIDGRAAYALCTISAQ
jgi:hypothetical protein